MVVADGGRAELLPVVQSVLLQRLSGRFELLTEVILNSSFAQFVHIQRVSDSRRVVAMRTSS